jgi:hypothetical protein
MELTPCRSGTEQRRTDPSASVNSQLHHDLSNASGKRACRGCCTRRESHPGLWVYKHLFGVGGNLLMVVLVLLLVGAPGDNGSPQRSEKIEFALAQSVRAQSAPANQIPTCERLLSESESDPRTQQASPEERQFVLTFLQAYVQSLLVEGVPGASRLDLDGNGIACDELRSADGGQSASGGRASPRPLIDGGSQLLNRYGNILEAG